MTTQTLLIGAYDYGATTPVVKLRNKSTLAEITVTSIVVTQSANLGAFYSAVITNASVVAAGDYVVEVAVGSADPGYLWVTLAGTDGETAYTRSEYQAGGGSGGLSDAQDTKLTAIYGFTSGISGARITTSGPVTSAGQIQLILGQDYTTDASNSITLPVPDSGSAIYDAFTSATLAASTAFGASRENGNAVIEGTITSITYASSVTTFTIEIDGSQLPDTLDIADDWVYQLQRTTSGGKLVVGVQGGLKTMKRTV